MHKTLSSNPSLPQYLLLSSAYLSIQALVLLVSPKLVVTLLAHDPRPPTTELESYLCRALACSLLTIGGYGISCAIALGRASEGDDTPSPGATSATDLILPMTLAYHIGSAVQAYVNYSFPMAANSGFLVHLLGSAIMSVYGVWVLIFGSQVRVSSVDGHDKRVSGFLFGGGAKEKEKGT